MLFIPVASKVGSPRFLNFGLSLRTEFARFTRILGSKSATIFWGEVLLPLFNAQEIRIPFLGRIFVNGSFQWLNVPRPLGETKIITAAWTENTFIYGWGTNPTVILNHSIRRCTTFQSVPINLCDFSCQSNHDRLIRIRVDPRQAIERELHARIFLEICDEVMSDDSNDGWLKEFD